jgi:hypothetical protein
MGVPPTFLGSGTQAGLGSAITLTGSKRYLVIDWEDIDQAINSTGAVPDTLEDWLGAIVFHLIDRTLADTNAQGQKITAGRRFAVGDNGRGLDEGQFESGQNLAVYSAVIALYTPDTNPTRPTAANL